MTDVKVVFIHGVNQRVLQAITSRNPEGFTTLPVEGKATPEEKQIEAVKGKILGVLLNDVDLDRDGYHYRYYRYYDAAGDGG